MENKPTIKPCPFCGEIPRLLKHLPKETYQHSCDFVSILTQPEDTYAIEKWNTRSPTEFEVEAKKLFTKLMLFKPIGLENLNQAKTLNTTETLLLAIYESVEKFLEDNP